MRACPSPVAHQHNSVIKSPFLSSKTGRLRCQFPARARVEYSGFKWSVLRCTGDDGSSSVFDPDRRREASDVELDFLELKREVDKECCERSVGNVARGKEEEEEEKVVLPEMSRKISLESEEEESVGRIAKSKAVARGRQMLKRSSLLAKKVISIQSACSLGFISQLWVDTTSWMVVVIEVRPSILSGENDKFLLEDVRQVGDVVLVQDESVMENELRLIGLDTLVGYNVMTSDRRTVGKVRGFNFNINTGALESLELDSYGMWILPSSLVSTFSLLIEDVLDVMPDIVVVRDDAISRLQRLTKGFWGKPMTSGDDIEEYTSFRRQVGSTRRKRAKFQDFPSRTREIDDDWDMPMEY